MTAAPLDAYRLDERDLDAYLARIGLERPDAADGAALAALQEAHLLAVPFENLDIHLGVAISLDPAALVDKLVRRRRGGFCYEQNLLFAAALRGLGFDVVLLGAEVRQGDGDFGAPFDHLCLEVALDDGPVLADVGSGRGPLHPLAFVEGWQPDGSGQEFRLLPVPGDRFHLEFRSPDGTTGVLYRFDRRRHQPADYEGMCRWHQTSSDSPFTQGWVCSLRLAGGRVTASTAGLVETTGDERTERPLASAPEVAALLVERFGMAPLDVPDAWFEQAEA